MIVMRQEIDPVENKEILHQLEKVQVKLAEHNEKIILVFEYIKQLEQEKRQITDQQNRKRIGYKRGKE